MTAHQKLQLIRHLESACRLYEERGDRQEELVDCQQTLAWVRDMKTEG